MSIKIANAKLLAYAIPALIATIILLDFSLPGTEFTEDVVKIKRERQNYYNAGGNYHYTYEIVTPTRTFTVSKSTAEAARDSKINYTVSSIFEEVNSYSVKDLDKSSIHSFRLVSGLVYPLIVLLFLFIAYKYNKNWATLLFVLQVVLLADLFLLMQ